MGEAPASAGVSVAKAPSEPVVRVSDPNVHTYAMPVEPLSRSAEREELLEFLRGQRVLDPKMGEPLEPEEVEALLAQEAKPPEEWTLEEIEAAAERRWEGRCRRRIPPG